jgi:hypothetical protein
LPRHIFLTATEEGTSHSKFRRSHFTGVRCYWRYNQFVNRSFQTTPGGRACLQAACLVSLADCQVRPCDFASRCRRSWRPPRTVTSGSRANAAPNWSRLKRTSANSWTLVRRASSCRALSARSTHCGTSQQECCTLSLRASGKDRRVFRYSYRINPYGEDLFFGIGFIFTIFPARGSERFSPALAGTLLIEIIHAFCRPFFVYNLLPPT